MHNAINSNGNFTLKYLEKVFCLFFQLLTTGGWFCKNVFIHMLKPGIIVSINVDTSADCMTKKSLQFWFIKPVYIKEDEVCIPDR